MQRYHKKTNYPNKMEIKKEKVEKMFPLHYFVVLPYSCHQ